jgi:hypothetical protein
LKNSIEAYAEGKTLGPCGMSLGAYLHSPFEILFIGSSTEQCRKFVFLWPLRPEFTDYLADCERKFTHIPGHCSELEKHP